MNINSENESVAITLKGTDYIIQDNELVIMIKGKDLQDLKAGLLLFDEE